MLCRKAAAIALLATPLLVQAIAAGQMQTELVASGLSEPLFLSPPQGDSRLFVAQRAGQIRLLNGTSPAPTFLSISTDVTTSGEGGLLGLAFAPDFLSSGVLYANYTTPSGAAGGMDTVIQRITVSDPTGTTAGALTRAT